MFRTLGVIGFLAFLVGLVSVFRPLKALGIKSRQVGILVLVGGLVLMVVAGSSTEKGTPAQSTQSAQVEQAQTSQLQATAQTTQEATKTNTPSAATPSPSPPPPPPKKDYLEVGHATTIGIWEIAALGKPSFYRRIGDEFLGESADSGYLFALVPIRVKNTSKKTDSLSFAIWTMKDDEGNEYDIQTMADMYLDEDEQLDVTQVPPGAARNGYLVFQVKEDVSELFLELSTSRGRAKWKVYPVRKED